MSYEMIGITILGGMITVQAVATIVGLWGIGRILLRITESIGDLRRELAIEGLARRSPSRP